MNIGDLHYVPERSANRPLKRGRSNHPSYSRSRRSVLRYRHLLRPLLTSDGASENLSIPVAQRHAARSPRVLRTRFHAYARRIYVVAFRIRTGLCRFGTAHPATPPLSASCSSRQRFASGFLQTPSRPGNPCRAANTSPYRVCRGLPPPSGCALPGAPKKKKAPRAGPSSAQSCSPSGRAQAATASNCQFLGRMTVSMA